MQNISHAELVSASYFIAAQNIKTLKHVQGDIAPWQGSANA
jgi:hypothetical protein